MARGKTARGRIDVPEDVIRATFTFAGDDALLIREYMREMGYTNANLAVRTLVVGALSDYPKWGVATAERRVEYYEFQHRIREEFHVKLRELQQSIMDEIVLMKGQS